MKNFDFTSLAEQGLVPHNTLAANVTYPEADVYRFITKAREKAANGEYYETVKSSVKRKDSERFIKLFTAKLGVVAGLQQRSLCLFCYVLHQLSYELPNTDEVYLSYGDLTEWLQEHGLKLSKTQFDNAKKDLIALGIIKQKWDERGCEQHYINPGFFFNGRREKYFDHLIEKTVKKDMEQLELPFE